MDNIDFKDLLLSFQGRIRRLHYWIGAIAVSVAAGVIVGILGAVGGMANNGAVSLIVSLLSLVVYAAALWADIALGIKRCHDRDKSGWFLLIGLIPIIGGLWLLVDLGFLDGTQGPNKYGPSPKGIGGDAPAAAAT